MLEATLTATLGSFYTVRNWHAKPDHGDREGVCMKDRKNAKVVIVENSQMAVTFTKF